jgi:hypothetical protein
LSISSTKRRSTARLAAWVMAGFPAGSMEATILALTLLRREFSRLRS